MIHTRGVLASSLASALLLAGPVEGSLRWRAEPGCPDAARGAALVTEALGGPLPAEARVEVVLAEVGDQHEAVVRVGEAARTLRASECETLARAAALIVAVSIDAVRATAAVTASATADETAPSTRPGPVIPEVPMPRVEPVSAERPRIDDSVGPEDLRAPVANERRGGAADALPREAAGRAGSHWLGAAGLVGRVHLPALTGGARFLYAWQRSALRIEVAASYAAPRRIVYEDETDVGGRFQAAALSVRGCFVPSTGRLGVLLCGGAEGGPILGRGIGVDQERRPIGTWVAASLGGGVRIGLGRRVALAAGLDLLLGLRRPAFHVGERATLLRSPGAGLRLFAGLEIRLR